MGINAAYELSKKVSSGNDDGILCCETPQVTIGIFFDGTGNNKENDKRDPKRSPTNIAKLFERYKESKTKYTFRKYIQGIGAVEDEDDSLFGLAFAIGSTGGEARLHDAIKQVTTILEIIPENVGEIVFDVFGFSRGAALARHFVNMINHGLPDLTQKPETTSIWDIKLNPNLLMAGEPYSKRATRDDDSPQQVVDIYPRSKVKTRVRFVGLYDSVGSFYWPGNEDEGSFNLNLKAESAQYVYHLTAGQEVREKFPLTSVKNGDSAPGHFIELAGVGVHSDIGGGYADPAKNPANIERIARERYNLKRLTAREYEFNREDKKNELLTGYKARAAEKGWTLKEEAGDIVHLIEERHTRPQLAHLALHRMHKEALSRQVPFLELPDDDLHRIPDDLKAFAEQSFTPTPAGHAAALSAIESLTPPYIHTSAFRYPLGTEQMPHTPEQSNTRRIFSNWPEKAS